MSGFITKMSYTVTVRLKFNDDLFEYREYINGLQDFRHHGSSDFKDSFDIVNSTSQAVVPNRVHHIRGHPYHKWFYIISSPSFRGAFDYEIIRKPSCFDGFLMGSYSDVERSWFYGS